MINTNIERYQWIDYAKSIGIFLVVYSHLGVKDIEYYFVFTFHVPLFFYIAGYLSAKDDKIFNIKKRIERLLLPYIYLYLISLIFIFGTQAILEHKFNLTTFSKTLIGLFWKSHSYPYAVNAPLWFLLSLLTVEIIFQFFIKKKPWVLIIFCLISLSFYLYNGINILLTPDWSSLFLLSLLGLNYYCLGYFIKSKMVVVNLQKLSNTALFILGFTAFLSVYVLANNGNVWCMGDTVYAYFTSFAGGAIGCFMITAICLLLEKKIGGLKPINFISLNTLLILGLQTLSNKLAKQIISHFSIPSQKILFTTILSITLLVPIIMLINKFFPQIGGRRYLNSR